MKKIGIFTGTFDPVHDGHLEFAKQSMNTYGLNTVLFIPERKPRYKPDATDYPNRLDNIKQLLENTPFTVFSSEQDNINTNALLSELAVNFPEHELVFLIGSDVAVHSLPHWDDISSLSRFLFVVGMRSTETTEQVTKVFDELGFEMKIIKTHLAHLSSSSIRK